LLIGIGAPVLIGRLIRLSLRVYQTVNVHSKVARGDHLKLTHPGGGKAHRRAAPK